MFLRSRGFLSTGDTLRFEGCDPADVTDPEEELEPRPLVVLDEMSKGEVKRAKLNTIDHFNQVTHVQMQMNVKGFFPPALYIYQWGQQSSS